MTAIANTPTPAAGAFAEFERLQREAVSFLRSHPSALLHVGMGGGKTATAIWAIEALDLRRVLIACTQAVAAHWPAQITQHAKGSRSWLVVDVSAMTVAKAAERVRQAELEVGPDRRLVIVTNYEKASYGLKAKRPLGDLLASMRWDVVIYDEIQKVKTHDAAVTKWAKRMVRVSGRRWGLSGTPYPHSPLDAFGVTSVLDGGATLGIRWMTFRDRYAVMGGPERRWVQGYRNLEELAERLAPHTFHVAQEILDRALPETREVSHPVRLSAAAARHYAELRDELVTEVSRLGEVGHEDRHEIATAANALAKLLRLQQLTSGVLVLESGEHLAVDHAKEAWLAQFLTDLDPAEPVVVFGRFHADLDAVHRAGQRASRPVLELSGRVKEWTRWQHDLTGGEVLATQLQAGGAGVELTRAAHVVYLSTGHNLGDYLQSQKRSHRRGQLRPVTYHHVTAVGTVDEQVQHALAARLDVLDHLRRLVSEKGSIQ